MQVLIPSSVIFTIISPFVVLGVTFLVVRLYQTIVKRFRGKVPTGLVASFQQFGSWVIWGLGIIVALSTLGTLAGGINDLLLLIVGLAGFAVILAYRDVLSEIVSSQFISTYQPVKVGEWIEVEKHYGRVIEMDLIETKLVTPNNEIVVIPNSILMKQSIVNKTRSGSLRLQIPIYAKRGLDLREVEDHLLEISRGMKVDLASDFTPDVRVIELTPEYTRLELLVEVANPAKRDLIVSEIQKRVYELMQELERQLLIHTHE